MKKLLLVVAFALLGFPALAQGPGGLGISLVTDGTTTLTNLRQMAFTCCARVSSAGAGTGIVNVQIGGVPTSTQTTNFTVPVSANGTYYNNTGATGSVTFTLPPAVPGLNYGFTVDAAQTVEVLGSGTDQIAIGASNSSSENITASAAFATVVIYAYKTGQWVATSSTGTWTVH